MLVVVFLTTVLLISTVSIAPNVLTEGRREKETEMIWRGKQYTRGVKLYYRKMGRFPTSLDDLTKPKLGSLRFMRQAYKDPMNKEDGSWRFIYVGPAGQLIGSLKPRRNRYSCKCIEWSRQFRTIWRPRQTRRIRSARRNRSAHRRRTVGPNRDAARRVNFRFESAKHDGNSRQRRPGRRFVESFADSFCGHTDDYRRQHHRRRQQSRQVFHHHLRQGQKLSPVRIYLGSVEGYFRSRAARSADRNGIGPASGPTSWTKSFWSATGAEPNQSATKSDAKSAAAAAVVFIAAGSEAVPSVARKTQLSAQAELSLWAKGAALPELALSRKQLICLFRTRA